MTKKRSKGLFVVFAILLVICLFACFVNFTYPFSIGGNYYSYSNFVSNIKLGEDIGNSLRIVYRAELPEHEKPSNYSNLKNHTIQTLKDIVQGEGYKDVAVAEYGEDCISLQIGNILTEDDKNSLISLIGNPATLSFSTNSDGSEPFTTYENIKSVEPFSNTSEGAVNYYVLVEFSDDFKQEIAEISANNVIYVYLGDEEFIQGGLSKGAIDENGIIPLSNPNFKSMTDAQTVANQIKTGMLPLELSLKDCDVITPSYGVGANVWLSVALAILVLTAFVYLIIKYKHAGWLSCFAMLFYIVIGLFLIQSIPTMHINLSGFIAMGICFLIALETIIALLETAKRHYQDGTKLYVAFKVALKENLASILIKNVFIMLVGFACMFMPALSLQSFGWVAFVLPIVSIFISLALMRLFIHMYLALNNEDGKKCNFHKGGKNA